MPPGWRVLLLLVLVLVVVLTLPNDVDGGSRV
jgi:hypothetical protein